MSEIKCQRSIIIKQVASNKSSLLQLFTKIVKTPSKEAWVWIGRESN